jgi:23S rRNA pseudouridine1911/1915/1917 synthase
VEERKNRPERRPVARAAAKYTIYNVTEPSELMEFLMKKMSGISRTRVKALLTNRVVMVDNNIQTHYNFPLKPGMKVQISKEKNKHEFHNPLLNILYEDAYLIVVEKKEGLLSVATDRQKERTAQHILNEYVKRQHPRNRVFVVHRLDRETSGIMMYAKDEKTQHTLRDNWHDIVFDRRYVSIVMGGYGKRSGYREVMADRP